MGNLDENFDLIERYFDGELNEEELDLFQQKLKTDTAFADAYHAEKELIEGIQAAGNLALAQRINAIHEKKMAERSKTERAKEVPMMRRLRRIAAVLVVLVIAGLAIWKMSASSSTDSVFAAYYKAPSFSELTRGGDESSGSIEKNFANKNFKAALVELDNMLSKNPKDEPALLMKAICQIEIKDYQAAKESLLKISSTFRRYDTAVWYLALSYVKLDQLDAAKLELNKLINGAVPTAPKRIATAKRLLNDLE